MRRCFISDSIHGAMLTTRCLIGTSPVLPSSFPTTKVPVALLRWSDLCGLLWLSIHYRNDISMQSSTILLEPNNSWRPLHSEWSILDLLRNYQHRYGLVHLDFADARTLLALVVEEEQIWYYGVLCTRFLVSQASTTHSLILPFLRIFSVCFTTIYRMTTLA